MTIEAPAACPPPVLPDGRDKLRLHVPSDRCNVLILAALTAVLFFDVLFLGRRFYKGTAALRRSPLRQHAEVQKAKGNLAEAERIYDDIFRLRPDKHNL